MNRKLLVAALAFLCAQNAVAYELNGSKWETSQTSTIDYYISQKLSDDVTDAEAVDAIKRSYNAWTAITCSYLTWRYVDRTPITDWGVADGKNVASWRETNWGDSSVALGIASMIGAPTLVDSDIKFNGEHHSWKHYADGESGGDLIDISSVGTHEAGHASGLGHSNVPGATMWPSTGPGEVYGRTPSADDIAGLCELYANGGPVPEPDTEPGPLNGSTEFGGDCSNEPCVEGLFCVSDGRSRYCSMPCSSSAECGDDFYCAEDSTGGGVCAAGVDPSGDLPGFGESCGEGKRCSLGLTCVVHEDEQDSYAYCTGPCANGTCPSGYDCTTLNNGDTLCTSDRGTSGRPQMGEPCANGGLCEFGLLCANDPANVDVNNHVVPYCTKTCNGAHDTTTCDPGYNCAYLDTNGVVAAAGYICQKKPDAGDRGIGDTCLINALAPYEVPLCGQGLVCLDYVITNNKVTEPGFCSKNCNVNDCCPDGFGCVELTPAIGQCRPGREDSENFVCATKTETNADAGTTDNESEASGGGDSGCSQSGRSAAPLWLLAPLALLAVRRRRS